MITVLSPAKTLDFDTKFDAPNTSVPQDLEMSEKIVKKMRTLSKKKIGSLMSISKDLVELNAQRYDDWNTDFNEHETRPAILTFGGDVYRGMDNKNFTQADLEFANNHVRLLSGLHGVLNPLDRIKPYRLEMGTSVNVGRKKNLYQVWTDRVTDRINQSMEDANTDALINLASTEYSKVIDFKKVKGKVITPVFKDLKNGEYKVVMTWAKLARGMMAGYIVRNRLTRPEQLLQFNEYTFNEPMSNDSEWVFTRS